MSNEEAWSAVSLTVDGDPEYLGRVRAALGLTQSRRGEISSVDFLGESELSDKIAVACALVSNHAEMLADPKVTDVVIRIGWTPERSQDGFFLDVDSIDALRRARCSLAVDIYT